MKLQRHNLAMQWILRRRTNEVKGKANPLYNEFKKYQSALSDGFEGTMNEYMVSTFEQGGRVGMKPGGLVEPGVTHYAKFTEAEKAANVQAYLEKSGDTLEKFNTYDLNKQRKIKNKIITGVGVGKNTPPRIGQRISADQQWKRLTDTEPAFEEFIKSRMKEPTPDMKKVMNKYNLTADSSPKEFFSKMTNEYYEANKAKRLGTKSLITRNTYENLFRTFKDTFKPQLSTISVQEFVDQVPAMKGYKSPLREFTKLINEAGSEDVLKRLDRGSRAFTSKLSKVKQGKEFMQALEAAGIEMVETRTPEYIERRIRGGRPMEMSARRIKLPTIEQITAFSDSDYFKDEYRLSPNYKNKISTLSIKDPQYKVGEYGNHRHNLKQLQRVLNNKISSMTDAQLRGWVKNNPSLKKMVEFHFNPLNGEIEPIPLEKLTDYDLRRRVRIEKDHIRGRSTVGYDKATNKILDGIDVEFPKNYQLQPNAINHVAKGNVERWVAKNPNETAKIQKLDDFFKSTGSSYWDINAKKYRGASVRELSAYTDHLNIDMEQLLKSEEVFPAGHRDPITGKMRAGERIVEDLNLLAKIKKANLAMSPERKGLLGEGFSKFAKKMPKTAGAIGGTGRLLFSGAEMGALPLFLAAEGLYANYADKRDLKKALDQMVKNKLITQEQGDVLLEGFRQESIDLGDVGLETWAINQPNVQEKLEEIGYGDRTKLLKDARAPIADIREQDALAKQLKKQEIEKRTKEAYEDAIGRRTIEFKKGGRVSFKFGSMGRRGFLKLLAALGIGTAGAKAGLLGLSKVAGKKAAVKTGVDVVTGTPGMPSWFPALVNKVIKEGDDVTKKLGTVEREVVHTKKIDTGSASPDEVTVYRNLDTGDIRVEVDSVSNMGQAPVSLEYKAGQVIDEGKMAGKKTDPEFSAVESEPRVANPDGDIEFDGENIVGNVDDLFSDTTRVKNYAEGKKPTMKDIVTTKKKTDIVEEIHKDPGEYITNKYGDGPDLDYDDYLPGIDDID